MVNEVVLVAVDASKEVTEKSLEWALHSIIKAQDSLILLAVLPSHAHPIHQFLSCLLRKMGLHRNMKHSSDQVLHVNEYDQENSHRIKEICTQMMRQLCSVNNVRQVQTQVVVLPHARMGSVANQAREHGATWVILDRHLKKESKCCSKQLKCNVVLIEHDIPKILKSIDSQSVKKFNRDKIKSNPTACDRLGALPNYNPCYNAVATPSGTDLESQNTGTTETNVLHSVSGEDNENFHIATASINKSQVDKNIHHNSWFVQKEIKKQAKCHSTCTYGKSQSSNKVSRFKIKESPHMPTASPMNEIKSKSSISKSKCSITSALPQTATILTRRSTDSPQPWINLESSTESKLLLSSKRDTKNSNRNEENVSPLSENDRTSNIRMAMSLSIREPPTPPPLCSVCKHQAPILGKSPRKFSYREVERATQGFSSANILAEGGNGPVYRGVLSDGQVVAVKQHQLISAQGASEFCAEVEVLSCAQHRNLVMLVGYCIEKEWLLIYEFACNGSLDKHLYGRDTDEVMAWTSRMKVAIGAARGLRYLHEDCRVGCIVHRDFRPSNILLTHDFEPMVGDFGLARWQLNGESAVETRVVGAFGYLAPEYAKTGLITEKADVYSFGVVLMELLTGLKAIDSSRSKEQQSLPAWGRPLLEKKMINEIIDPRLEGFYTEKEVESMMYATSFCISPCRERRPTMSKVLRILEGDMPSEMAYDYEQVISALEHNIKNSCSKNGFSKQDYSPSVHMVQPMQRQKLSRYSFGAGIGKNQEGIVRPMKSLDRYKMERQSSGWRSSQTEQLFIEECEEYQAQLHGSLVEFLHKTKRS